MRIINYAARRLATLPQMGFLKSYLSLPRYQRVLLGVVGVAVGWYGPNLMSALFIGGQESTQPRRADSEDHVTKPAAPSS